MILLDPLALAALTLLHVLVLVYWLGGDLGAFVASHIISDAKAHPTARMAAAKVLTDVDMAPRSALVLAFPTGLALFAIQGGTAGPPWALPVVLATGLAWLVLLWTLHLRRTGAAPLLRATDIGLRLAMLGGLGALGLGAWPGDWPLYLRLKCMALAGAVLCGLAIRARLAPFSGALAGLARGAPSPEDDLAIARALSTARPLVVLIWCLVAAAALFGLWKPQ